MGQHSTIFNLFEFSICKIVSGWRQIQNTVVIQACQKCMVIANCLKNNQWFIFFPFKWSMPSLWTIFPVGMCAIKGSKQSVKDMLWFMQLYNWFDASINRESQNFINVALFDCIIKVPACPSTKFFRHLKIIQKCVH